MPNLPINNTFESYSLSTRLTFLIFLSLSLCLSSVPTYADNFQKGQDAFGKTALKLSMPLAVNRHSGAQGNIAWLYESGLGVPKDYKESVKWYRLSAEQGNAGSQNNLAGMYRNGKGVAEDYKEAVKFYTLAANQGYVHAQYNLDLLYEYGEGVHFNSYEAHKWFRLAADQGDASSQLELGMIYQSGDGVTINGAEALNGTSWQQIRETPQPNLVLPAFMQMETESQKIKRKL